MFTLKRVLTSLLLLSQVSQAQAITLYEYNHVQQKIISYYQSFGERKELEIHANWDSQTPNAYTKKKNDKIQIFILGGFLNSKFMSPNVLSLVLCHELGHHMGGYPFGLIQRRGYNDNRTDHDLSNEGQADFWAASKCMWAIINKDSNETSVNKECHEQYNNSKEINICNQVILAGKQYINLVESISAQSRRSGVLVDASRNLFKGEYPSLDCRLETYKVGALKINNRPRCWYYEF